MDLMGPGRTMSGGGYLLFIVSIILGMGGCNPPSHAGDGETLLAVFSSGSTTSSNRETPFTVEASNPNAGSTLDEPIPSGAGFGSSGPEARFDFDPRSFDSYSPIRIRFSHPVDISRLDIGVNFILRKSGIPIPSGELTPTWTSPITVSIRSNPALDQNSEYSLEINPVGVVSPLQTANASNPEPVQRFYSTFNTEPSFPVNLSVRSGASSFVFSNNNALVLDSDLHPDSSLQLRMEFSDPTNLSSVRSITLCKLGALQTSGTVACTEGVARGVTICEESSCTASLDTGLAGLPSALRPSTGANNYFYRIESFSGNYFYRTVNFIWGKLQKTGPTLSPASHLNLAANLSIVQEEGARAVAGIIESFAKGDFTLKDPVDNNNKSLNQYLNNSSSTHPGTVDGKTCLPWPMAKFPNGIQYLNRIGPFCGINVTGTIFESAEFPNVNYEATADIYITDLTLDESVWNGSEFIQNAELSINPENGYLDLTLNGKKASGRMAVVAKVTNIEFFDYLLNDTLVYYTPPTGAPGYGGGSGPDGVGITFGLNEGNTTPRRAFARTSITANSSGEAVISLNPSAFPEPFNLATQCGTLAYPVPFPFSFICNPFTTPWSDNITTSSVVGTGAVAAIVGDVIQQKIPEVKPKVVQGVIRDIATKVAPDILNNILGQVRTGVNVNLPGYLPSPLNQVQLSISAILGEGTGLTNTRRSGSNFGLEALAHASLLACIRDGSNRCPWQAGYSRPAGSLPPEPNLPGYPGGSDSFIVERFGVARSLPSTIDLWSSNPGVLLSLHEDSLNQAFFWLWKTGGLNLTINKSFIDSINQFTGGSTLLRLTNSLLKADPILTVIAPGSSNFAGIYPNDDVDLVVTPVSPPQIQLKPLDTSISTERPKIDINLSDLKLSIVGRRTDPARGSTPGTPYTIGNLRVTVRSEASLNIGTYQLPPNDGSFTFSPTILASVGNPSLQIQISADSGKLFYILEVLDDPTNNPLGLKPADIFQVIEPLVKDLIVPLLNNIVRDIPIPKLRACGLDLTHVTTVPLATTNTIPHILIHANAGNYGFFGNCEL